MGRWLGMWLAASLLGVLTIGTYGIAQYAFSVFIDPIATDTGWSRGTITSAFSFGLLGSGVVAFGAGRALDRWGSRPILLPAVVVSALAYLLASWAPEDWQFVAAWGLAGAVLGGAGFYHMSIPMVTRIYGPQRTKGVAILTFLGALASPIFLPIGGWAIETWGWRDALRVITLLSVACTLPAALFVRAPAASAPPTSSGASWRDGLREAAVQRAFVLLAVASAGHAILLVHQVAAMQAVGLSVGVASAYAGARGFMQIPGRLVLIPLTSRAGLRGAMAICYAVAATAALALILAGPGPTIPLVIYYVAFAGMSLGMLSALLGLFQADVYGDHRVGSLTGAAFVVMTAVQALAAWLAGLAAEWTDGYEVTIATVVVLQASVLLLLRWQRAAQPEPAAVPAEG